MGHMCPDRDKEDRSVRSEVGPQWPFMSSFEHHFHFKARHYDQNRRKKYCFCIVYLSLSSYGSESNLKQWKWKVKVIRRLQKNVHISSPSFPLNLTSNQISPPPQSVWALCSFPSKKNTCQQAESLLSKSLDNKADLERMETNLFTFFEPLSQSAKLPEVKWVTESSWVTVGMPALSNNLVCDLYRPVPFLYRAHTSN